MTLKENLTNLIQLIERYADADVMTGCIEERLNKSFESYFEDLNTSYDNLTRLNNKKLIEEIKKAV